MASQVGFLNRTVARAEREASAPLAKTEPNITTIPGVSTTTGAQTVAEIGDVRRFGSAASIAKHAGLNSGVDESGKFSAEGVPITKHGSPYLRRSPWLAASRARQCDPRPKAFYDRKHREGKPHRAAATAVARKPCHIAFAVMRDGKPYDPAKWPRARTRPSAPPRRCGSLRPKAFDIRLSKCGVEQESESPIDYGFALDFI